MKKILISEDDINLSKLYELKLSLAGFNTEIAANGLECVNKALNWKPDLILLDIMMPKQNGFDTLLILKNNKVTENIPVIMLSNLSNTPDINLAMEYGAEEYLIKAKLELNELVAKVRGYLE